MTDTPNKLQLYSLATPNGQKVSIMLEELGLDYDVHKIDISAGDQFTPEFLAINPNNKIPALIDPDGPGGKSITLFESGAILIYLAEKYGRFLPSDAARRYHTIQWLMFQMGGIGPMFGQLGFFHRFAGREIEDPRPKTRYVDESKRLLNVLDQQLAGKEWIMGDEYTIADIAIFPWVNILSGFYAAEAIVGLHNYPEVNRVMKNFLARPAVQRGQHIPA
ncbi:MAG TPA: glutathione S-transferase N-terminal domain-containing protein [Cellvibrio sp.]|nr:glutathione S-transferase N-terminal domain-containing protein [Cellvibrio sp.]